MRLSYPYFYGWAELPECHDRHLEKVDEACIRSHLEEYKKRGITYVRDGGDHLRVSLRAKELAAGYGITYRSPVFAIYRKGCYGSIVERPLKI
jgi:hypothetical protein